MSVSARDPVWPGARLRAQPLRPRRLLELEVVSVRSASSRFSGRGTPPSAARPGGPRSRDGGLRRRGRRCVGRRRRRRPVWLQQVGQTVNGAILLPTNQWISPLGKRIEVSDARLVSSTLSPDGKFVAALSWNDFTGFLTMINFKTGAIVQQVGTGSGSDKAIGDGDVAADGPLYSADGTTLWVPQGARTSSGSPSTRVGRGFLAARR